MRSNRSGNCPKCGMGPEPESAAMLKLAATLERGSEHPLAEAIVRGAENRGVTLAEAAVRHWW